DLKDENNAIFETKPDTKRIYRVSDLGATFGTTGFSWHQKTSKGNLKSYRKSKFITRLTPEYVDFGTPSRPALIRVLAGPEFVHRLQLRWIGKGIPRSDAHWIGELLGRLSEEQIQDAFRAAGYSAQDTRGFTDVVRSRIAELNRL